MQLIAMALTVTSPGLVVLTSDGRISAFSLGGKLETKDTTFEAPARESF